MSELYDISKLWQDWQTVRLIGEGSFGKVYEIVRNRFGIEEHCALKVITIPTSSAEIQSLKNDGMDDHSVTAYYRGLVGEVVQEIALMKKLRDNNNIVRYEDFHVVEHEGDFGWDIIIRMELLKASSTHFRENSLTVADVLCLGIDMCKALEECETHKIIHRDIKPDNIFISENGTYKLGDFGVARTIDKTMAGLSKKGTYTYMAPEVYKGEDYGTDVDIYSLGIVMYKLLNNNREPFLPAFPQIIQYSDKSDALVYRMNGREIPPIADINERLNSVILKACAFKSENRYHSATQLKADLQNVLENLKDNGEIITSEETSEVKTEKTVSVFGTNRFEISAEDEFDDDKTTETVENDFEIAKDCSTPYDFDTSVRLDPEVKEGTVGVFDNTPVFTPEEISAPIDAPVEFNESVVPQTDFMSTDCENVIDEPPVITQDDFTSQVPSLENEAFVKREVEPEYSERACSVPANDFGQTSFTPKPAQDFSSGHYTPSSDFDPFGGGSSFVPKHEAKPYSGPTAEDFEPKPRRASKSKSKWWIFAIIGAAVIVVVVAVVMVIIMSGNKPNDDYYIEITDVVDVGNADNGGYGEDVYSDLYPTEVTEDYSEIFDEILGVWVYEDEFEITTIDFYDPVVTDDPDIFTISYTRSTEMKSESAFSSDVRGKIGTYLFDVRDISHFIPEHEDGTEGFEYNSNNNVLIERIYYNIYGVSEHSSEPTGREFIRP